MKSNNSSYHRSCLTILFSLLGIWFLSSFCCGILFRDWMDLHIPSIGNAPFGFWMAQQGSIIIFVLIIISYAFLMNKLDDKHGYSEEDEI
ncbi:MAG: DUF4212 domain-containing protein [Pontiellaceae bacterium]